MKNNNTGWWVFGLVVVAILIIAIGVHAKRDVAVNTVPAATDASGVAMATNPDGSGIVSTEDTSTGSVDASAPAPLTYQQALTLYGTDRIQFNPTCEATPSQQTFPNNTEVMLDNRSATPEVLHLGSLGDVSVKAWGFKIVDFTSTLLPNVITIDCGAQQNVAQITIQS